MKASLPEMSGEEQAKYLRLSLSCRDFRSVPKDYKFRKVLVHEKIIAQIPVERVRILDEKSLQEVSPLYASIRSFFDENGEIQSLLCGHIPRLPLPDSNEQGQDFEIKVGTKTSALATLAGLLNGNMHPRQLQEGLKDHFGLKLFGNTKERGEQIQTFYDLLQSIFLNENGTALSHEQKKALILLLPDYPWETMRDL